MLKSICYIGTCIICVEGYAWIGSQLIKRLAPQSVLAAHTNINSMISANGLLRVVASVGLEEMTFRLPCVLLSASFSQYKVLFVTLQAIGFGFAHVPGLISGGGYHWSILSEIIVGGLLLGWIATRTPAGFLIGCLCHFVHNVLCSQFDYI